MSSKPWTGTDFHSADDSSGASSGSSSADSSLSFSVAADCTAITSGRKKRRREPRLIQGYKCPLSACEKTFDTAGELNKHNKFHMSRETYPYCCERCQKAFLYPKDLRRHQGTQAHAEQEDIGSLEELKRVPNGEANDQDMASALGGFIFANE